MAIESKKDLFQVLFPNEPAFRWRQIEAAFFKSSTQPENESLFEWNTITTLPKAMREILTEKVPWMSVREAAMYESNQHDTWKVVLEAEDGKQFESVFMSNRQGDWTICVSSQVGCAMRCTFCATGTMGLKRSLNSDEIIDQYRFWQKFLLEKKMPGRISNVVFMGMGEPMANYENVKNAIQTWLRHTDLGPTRITVSTVGILPQLEKLLLDPDWPHVRVAVSLHSANQKNRESIVPTTVPDFLIKLADWSKRYHATHATRRQHITYEYTLLNEVNDTPEHARELAKYIRKTGVSKINVIPYNPVAGKSFVRSQRERIDAFKQVIRSFDLTVTERKTMGDDIAAACGQLVVGRKE